MKKLIIFLCAVISFSDLLRGQDSLGVELSQEFLEVMADTCRPPKLIAKAVINYENYSRAYLEFEGTSEGQIFGYQKLDGVESDGQVSSINGEILIEGLDPDELFEVTTLDNCGNEVAVAVISTYADNPSIRGIEVSEKMYQTIVEFQQQDGSVPLPQFLEEAEGVSQYEKLSFFQQYYFLGQKFQTDDGLMLPPPPNRTTNDGCHCIFVFNTTQNATPGTLLPDGTILAKNKDSGGKIDLPGNAHYWWASSTKGAAKWNAIQSEGWKAGSDEHELNSKVINNINSSPYIGQVGFNLLCTNYANLPRECDREKKLLLYYRYDTEVLAYATRHTGGISEKKSKAASQDLAVVTLSKGGSDNVQVLAAGDVRAEAECNWQVNSQFWVNLIDLAVPIAQFFINDNSSGLQTLIENLSTQLSELVTTPFLAQSQCNANATVEATLADGHDIEVTFHPNEAAHLQVMSFSNLMCGGKRSWFSWANVNSNFYAAGIVPGGLIGEGQNHCCTQKIGSWVLASVDGPLSTEETSAKLGYFFGLQGPWGMPSGPGNITQLTEWGWDVVIADERCIVSVNGDGSGTGGGDPLDGAVLDYRNLDSGYTNYETNPLEATYVVYDISGRLVFQGEALFDKADVLAKFREQASSIPTGLYFIQLTDGLRKETFKVFYSR
ncbi:MAG: hypothetical protein CMN32_08730 [Saprospirales bacterium]|nr:hypothetical protein [Saprospirales bacterium]